MADEIIGNVESKTETVGETTQTTTTNKVWDQSEHDRAIAEALRAERAKFQDYDKIKQSFESLQKEKEELEMKEKSELEKKELELSRASQKLEEYENNLKTFKLKEVRDKVLSSPKYADLPSVYKNAVSLSDNEMDLQAEADKVLEQYNNDFQVKKTTFGKADTVAKQDTKAGGVINSAMDLKERLAKRLNII